MRRTCGSGTTLPSVWMVGGFFYVTENGSSLRGLWQNIQTEKNGQADWIPFALEAEAVAAMTLIFGDVVEGDDGELY